MKEENLYTLLDVIYKNGSVKRLTRNGISFNEIAKISEQAILDGLIINTSERIILTGNGIELLKSLEKKYKKTNKNEWIDKELKSQVKRIDKNFIFLPSQNELTFQVIS